MEQELNVGDMLYTMNGALKCELVVVKNYKRIITPKTDTITYETINPETGYRQNVYPEQIGKQFFKTFAALEAAVCQEFIDFGGKVFDKEAILKACGIENGNEKEDN